MMEVSIVDLAYLKKRMVTEGRYSEPEISSLLIIHLS
jgi:hypothetical protein